jgi:tetratricopeptide (TPR) repeat protein/tRNA A-37 threonylcarbamoyl transferase component Bud32
VQGLIGQEVGGYRIVSQIGKGGMATVFKAYQASLDRYVAVKVMPPFYAEQDDTFLKRFRQEAKAIASLRHPNILIVIDYGEENETTYIVMEFVEAGTLTEMMGKPMAPDQMMGLVDQVAGALHYAHGQGVVHRDIKPSNILLPKPDWPLLTDFGLAKIVGGSQLTQSGTVAGTPAYMSPEQGRGEKVDPRSDIYSLGIVLYEMATGVVPFHAETPMAVVVKHIIDPLPLPRSKNPELPEEIERVILKSLSKDAADRFQDADEMAKALNEAVRGLPAGVARAVPAVPTAQVTTMVDEAEVAAESEEPALRAAEGAVEVEVATGASGGIGRLFSGRGRIAAAAVGGLLVLAVIAVGAAQLLGGTPEDPGASDPGQPPIEEEIPEPGQQEGPSAIEGLDLAIEQDPENVELYFARARAHAEEGELDLVYDAILQGVQVMPEESWVHESAADVLWELGLFDEAITEYGHAIELDPEAYWLYYNIAEIYQQTGRQDEAIAVLFEAIENPAVLADPEAMNSFGWFLLDMEMLDEAEAAFRRSIDAEPGNPSRYEGLLELAYRRGGPAAGIEAAEIGIEQFPDHSSFYEFGAYMYWELDDLDQAIPAFNRAIELDPSNPGLYGSLASVLVETDREAEAIELIQSGLDRYPNAPESHIVAADFYMAIGLTDEAILMYDRAIELDPDDAWSYASLARAEASLGNPDLARQALGEANERNFGDPWLDEFIGWTYIDIGDCQEAIDYFVRALEIDASIESAEQGIQECGG